MTNGNKTLKFISFLYFFIILGGGINMLINGPSDFRDFNEDRSQFTNVVFLANGGVVCLLFLVHPVNVFKHVYGFKFFFILIGVILLGVAGSYDPLRSLTIIAFLSMNLFSCLYICAVLRPVDVLKSLGLACFLSVILSFLFIFIIPSYGRMTYVFPGAWQGIFIHKNVLGKFATLALIVSLCLRDYWARPFWIAAVVSSAALAIGTGSATSTLATVIILAAYLATKRRAYLMLAGLGAVVMTVFAFLYTEVVMSALTEGFDKSATLSGRTTLWDLSIQYISTKPFLGYGLGAFWRTPDAQALRAAAGWVVPHAHNGVLELALNVGYVGVAAYLILFSMLVRLAVRALNSGTQSILLLPLFVVMHTVIYAIGEANLVRPNSYTEVMFVVALSSVFKFLVCNEEQTLSSLASRPDRSAFQKYSSPS